MNTESTEAWSGYWELMQASGRSELPSSIREADHFFLEGTRNVGLDRPRVLDLASGNGALVKLLMPSIAKAEGIMVALDASFEAVDLGRREHQGIAVQSRLEALPFSEGTFDLIVSQFGVEYAQSIIWPSIVSVLRSGACLCLLMHARTGVIFKDYSVNFERVKLVEASLAFEIFRGLGAVDRSLTKEHFDYEAKQFETALKALGSIVDQSSMVSEFLQYISSTLTRIRQNAGALDLDNLQAWIQVCHKQWRLFGIRIEAMLNAALSEDEFLEVQEELSNLGIRIKRVGELRGSKNQILGYKLIGLRR